MSGKDIRDKLPKYLRSFDKLLRKVNTGYFVGEQVSLGPVLRFPAKRILAGISTHRYFIELTWIKIKL